MKEMGLVPDALIRGFSWWAYTSDSNSIINSSLSNSSLEGDCLVPRQLSNLPGRLFSVAPPRLSHSLSSSSSSSNRIMLQ